MPLGDEDLDNMHAYCDTECTEEYDFLSCLRAIFCCKRQKQITEEELLAHERRKNNSTNFHDATKVRGQEREKLEILRLQQQNIFKQNHPWRQNWDIFVMILAIYNSIMIPIEMAYMQESLLATYTVSDFLNNVTDIFFLIDIILNFHTTTTDELTGEEKTTKYEIAICYLRFQFWVDLASTVPLDLILQPFLNKQNAKQLSFLQILKLIRILRL